MRFENLSVLDDGEVARRYVDGLAADICQADGVDLTEAMRRIGRQVGEGYWTIWGIAQGRTKTPRCLSRLRLAHLSMLERKVTRMLAEIDIERKLSRSDDELEGLAVELSVISKKIATRKEVISRR